MAGGKGLYRVFVMNLAGQDANNKWNEDAVNGVGNFLLAHFQRVVSHPACPYTHVQWYPGHPGMALDPGELLVYFVASYSNSLIVAEGGDPDRSKSGATWETSSGMISEIWLDGPPAHPMDAPLSDPDYQQLLANMAFHELMHNKLDASSSGAVMNDIHHDDGTGLASQKIGAKTGLSAKNIALMAPNLARKIPQYTKACEVSSFKIDGMPVDINGKPASRP